MLDRDSYEGWVILSAYAGSFTFTLAPQRPADRVGKGRDGGGELSGECRLGDLVVCPPHTMLERTITTSPTSFLFVEFTAAPAPGPGKAKVGDVQRLRSTYDYIADRCAAPHGPARWDALAHLVSDLLFLISAARAGVERPGDPLMTQVAAHLAENAFSGELSLSEIADQFGLSPSQLTRRFRAAHGSSPVAYLTATRLARARQLLLETDQTLASIAAKCGYQNSFYFSRVFRQKMGINPSGYRRAYRI